MTLIKLLNILDPQIDVLVYTQHDQLAAHAPAIALISDAILHSKKRLFYTSPVYRLDLLSCSISIHVTYFMLDNSAMIYAEEDDAEV